MQLRAWRPLPKNTLVGFANITIDALGNAVVDVAIHQLGSRRWASLPGRPMIDTDGRVMRDEAGKIRYAAPFRWTTSTLASRFSAAVIVLPLRHHPNALDV
jgi:hypothetical protein